MWTGTLVLRTEMIVRCGQTRQVERINAYSSIVEEGASARAHSSKKYTLLVVVTLAMLHNCKKFFKNF